MTNLFLGLDADQWEASDGHPRSSWSDGEPLTSEDIRQAIVAMLRRLDAADNGGQES